MNRTPAIIGFLIAGAVILGAGFLAGLRDPAPDAGAPALRVVSPVDGDSVTNPVAIEFTSAAELQLGIDGWTAGDLHLHIMIDDVEHMPAASDLSAGTASYTWTLPPLEPGPRRVYLTWAGRHHRNLATPTDTLRLHVLP